MLLSFKNIWKNNYHVETTEKNGMEYHCIVSYENDQKHIHEKMGRLLNGLYNTNVRAAEAYHGMTVWDI